mmetsp:Transcript_13377/g.38515  ORF Transcript_13377/g.38515 Transcript_13377/m.38515 type:complete len:300 (+) Transcript_13377:65-964(+)
MGQELSSTRCGHIPGSIVDEYHEVYVQAPMQALPKHEEDSGSSTSSSVGFLTPFSSSDGLVSKHRRVIVFDWDDTLLCSTAVKTARSDELDRLPELEDIVANLLRDAQAYGEVMIITNGNKNWIRDSARRHLPGLYPLFAEIRCISARHLFEASFPGDPYMWKQAAFRNLFVQSVAPDSGLNILAIGDQMPEIEATWFVCKELGARCHAKTVKFKEQPTIAELVGQLRKLRLDLEQLASQEQSCDFTLARCGLAPYSSRDRAAAQSAGWQLSQPSFRDAPVIPKGGTKVGFRNVWPLLA